MPRRKFYLEESCKEVANRLSGLDNTYRINEDELKSVLWEQQQLE